MIRSLKAALAAAVLASTMLVGSVSAHGQIAFFIADPSCSRSGSTVGMAIDNPIMSANPAGVSYAAFYVQGYYYGDPGWITTAGSYWFGSYADNTYPSWLYNYGNASWADAQGFNVTSPTLLSDYYRVWVYVYWADGHQGWAGATNYCLV